MALTYPRKKAFEYYGQNYPKLLDYRLFSMSNIKTDNIENM